MKYLPNESCWTPGCEKHVILRGYCGDHWNQRARRKIERMRRAIQLSKEATQLCAVLLANQRLVIVRL